jgi:eukaryotic-like serine/threonine-protein kinase
MTPDRWQQIKALLQSALEQEPRQRAAFLAKACSHDEPLRAHIESLILSYEQAGGFIESPAFELMAESLSDQTDSMVGHSFGPYQISTLIGSGGMGEVYLAEDTRLGRKVALKILPSFFTRDDERLRRFQQEARAVSALNHPNILTIYEIGQSDSRHFIATEFIEGETLRQRMTTRQMKIGEVLDVATQVASALSAAHQTGIAHRDIKPENIMLRQDGLVKVVDFGLAKLTEQKSGDFEAATLVNTTQGTVMGTAHYMSPEQARGLKVDARSDIFSLGVVLYEMLTGRVPFTGQTMTDVLASILMLEPASLNQSAPETPDELQRIVHNSLRKNKEERYQAIKDMLIDLKTLKQELEFETRRGRYDSSGRPPLAPNAWPAKRYTGSGDRSQALESLAVLPFINASDDAKLDYVSDGITESIINNLSQLPRLRVFARSTMFRYKDQATEPQTIGRELGASAVLMGRVLQRGDRLVVSVELVDTTDETQLWGEHYNRKLADVFELQDEIAREITEKLRLKLSPEEKGRLNKRHTENVEAYQAYLKGRYFWNKRTTESLDKGVEYFKQAIDLDPTYASAYAGLSDSYTLLVVRESLPPNEGFAKGKAAAAMALRIDNTLSEAHASLGHAMLHNWEWEAAEKELKRAIEQNPGYPSAHHWYSEHLTAMGRFNESIVELKLAAELDPLSIIINADLGRAFYYAREYDQVMKQEGRTLEMDSNFWLSHINLGKSYTQKGMHAEAINELRKARELSAGNTEALSFLGFAYVAAGERDEALKVLDELNVQAKRRHVPPYHFAILHAGLGEKNEAFDWLERAFEKHAVDLFTLRVEPMFDGLRSDPRFQDLLRRVGLARPSPEEKRIRTNLEQSTRAIAVLPFRPISVEGRDECLELGMADALITKLGNIGQILVRPTSSIRKYTDLEQDSMVAGRELRVESVLEGSIQRRADWLRVTARLVGVEDGRTLWADKFDENFTDIFAVQDSISEKVAAALSLKLSGEEKERLTKRYTENTLAYQLYLKGLHFFNKRSVEGYNKAIEYYQQAIEKDPNYALAYAGLADCYANCSFAELSPKDTIVKARAAASRALEIDDTLAEAHNALGHVKVNLDWDWSGAEREFKIALKLNPNYVEAHHRYSHYLVAMGRFDESLSESLRGLELDPVDISINTHLGWHYLMTGQNERAIEELKKTLELDQSFVRAHLYLGQAYERTRKYDEAFAEFKKVRDLYGQGQIASGLLGYTYAVAGLKTEAQTILGELKEQSKREHVWAYNIAIIHVGLGDKDRAFEWLGKACDDRSDDVIYLGVDSMFDPLRSDQRFSDLMHRVGLAV